MKTALVFPGQGAQTPGMGRELFEQGGKAKELFEQANEILGFQLTDIMFEGSAEDLTERVMHSPPFLCILLPQLGKTATVPTPWQAIRWANSRP